MNRLRGHLLTSSIMNTKPWEELAPPCPILQGLYTHDNVLGLDPARFGNVPSGLITHYHQLRCLTKHMLRVRSSGTPISDKQMFDFCRYRHCVELSLISLSETDKDNLTSLRGRTDWTSDRAYVFEAQRLAGLIYLNLVLRGCSPAGALLRALKAKLVSIIDFTKSLAYTECRPRMVVWIYFIGGFLSLGDQEEKWFAEKIAKTMRDAKIQTWAQVEQALRDVLWVDTLRTKTCKYLWQQVEKIQAGESDTIHS